MLLHFKKWRCCYCKPFYLSRCYSSKERSSESPTCEGDLSGTLARDLEIISMGPWHKALGTLSLASALSLNRLALYPQMSQSCWASVSQDKSIFKIYFSTRILYPRDLYYSKIKQPHYESLSRQWVYAPPPKLGQAFIFSDWDHIINKKSQGTIWNSPEYFSTSAQISCSVSCRCPVCYKLSAGSIFQQCLLYL